jgi:hypothetical protein
LTTRDRLHQIKREFLELEFPGPYPCRLRVERLNNSETDEQLDAVYYYGSATKLALIRVPKDLSRSESIMGLLHEWAHHITELHPGLERHRAELHDVHFDVVYGAIKRGFETWAKANPPTASKP